jgi:hypothetical protein
MVVPNRTSVTYRNLFEYSASIYPVALSELYIANWYSAQLLSVVPAAGSSPSTTTAQTIATYKTYVLADMALANADVTKRIAGDTSEYGYYSNVMERQAVIEGQMWRLGFRSFGDPNAAFQTLLAFFPAHNLTNDGTSRLQYAYFLVREYGAVRASDIQTLLAPIVTDPTHRGATIVSFLTNERSNALGEKATLGLLASIDPQFKAFLVSLGWQTSDFKK